MTKKSPVDDWKYLPGIFSGSHEFAGDAMPTKAALEVLGDEGLEVITNKINEMREWKKVLFGVRDPHTTGFFHCLKFINDVTKDVVKVTEVSWYQGQMPVELRDQLVDDSSIDDPRSYIIELKKKINDSFENIIEFYPIY